MIYPMFAMVLLTLTIGIITFRTRVNSVKSGAVCTRSYKLMDSEDFPENVIKTGRNFNNQFEIPVLFYVVTLAYLHFNIADGVALTLAWGFVISRCAHSFIHLRHNHILHRLLAFWSGVLIVLVLWVYLLILTSIKIVDVM